MVDSGAGLAERRVGESEVLAQVVQQWRQAGLVEPRDVRFAFAFDEQAEAALLARASVLQAAGHVSAYAAATPPPDISGLLRALAFYAGALDAESAAELLRLQADGAFLVRDGRDPDWCVRLIDIDSRCLALTFVRWLCLCA